MTWMKTSCGTVASDSSMVQVVALASAVHESAAGSSIHAVTVDPAASEDEAPQVTTTDDPDCSRCASVGAATTAAGSAAPADAVAAPVIGTARSAAPINRHLEITWPS